MSTTSGRVGCRFQSLSGFFRPCNLGEDQDLRAESRCVSIPVGFFQALQLQLAPADRGDRRVSIPVGFFQALQPGRARFRASARLDLFQSLSGFFRPCNTPEGSKIARAKAVFQSLSGFFRPCNHSGISHPNHLPLVSIPVGFFQALQLLDPAQLSAPERGVSIPVGFFQALQLIGTFGNLVICDVSIPVGFFQALQRNRPMTRSHPSSLRFNPCRVFSGLATPHSIDSPNAQDDVSIPVGFFQALQRHPWVGYFSI